MEKDGSFGGSLKLSSFGIPAAESQMERIILYLWGQHTI